MAAVAPILIRRRELRVDSGGAGRMRGGLGQRIELMPGAEQLFDALQAKVVRSTIFLTGDFIRLYPDVVRRIVAEGHEIGNHTTSHGYLTKMSLDQVRRDLSVAHQAVVSATIVPLRDPSSLARPSTSSISAMFAFISKVPQPYRLPSSILVGFFSILP